MEIDLIFNSYHSIPPRSLVDRCRAAVLMGLFEDPEPALPVNWFVQKEIGLVGSQGYNWDFQEALKWVARGEVDLGSLITHKFPLSQTQEAFELLMAPGNEAVKIAIEVETEVGIDSQEVD